MFPMLLLFKFLPRGGWCCAVLATVSACFPCLGPL